MRIVHVITRLIVGGAQENTILSCAGQHQRGHEVTLVCGPALGPEGSLMESAAKAGYRIEVIDAMRRAVLPVRDLITSRKLVALFRQLRPDIVHTHSSKAGILGRWAAKKAGVPAIVHTVHGLAFTASTHAIVNGFYRIMEKRAAPLTDRIVCVADAMRDQSLAAGIGKRDQYATIYSGMETTQFVNPPIPRPQMRDKFGFSDRDIVIGTIARLFHLKGHDDLLDVAPELCKRFPNLRFLWVGNGILRESFERRMTEMGLRDRFVLTGLVPPEQVPELVGAMDLLAHPSRREGLARALPQAQLAGKPVVTYDVDGNREGLIESRTGFAVAAFDKIEFAEKISFLAGNDATRAQMGESGRQFALGRFDAKVMVDALEALYAELMTKTK